MTSSWLVGPLFQSLFVLKTLNLSFFLFFNSSVFKILVNTFPSSLSNKVAMYHGLHPLICLGGWICSCVRWVQERNWTFYHLGFCLLWRSLCLVSAMEAIFLFLYHELGESLCSWSVNCTGTGWIVWVQAWKTVHILSVGMPRKTIVFSLVTSFFDGIMKASNTSIAHNSHILPAILTLGCLSTIAI